MEGLQPATDMGRSLGPRLTPEGRPPEHCHQSVDSKDPQRLSGEGAVSPRSLQGGRVVENFKVIIKQAKINLPFFIVMNQPFGTMPVVAEASSPNPSWV